MRRALIVALGLVACGRTPITEGRRGSASDSDSTSGSATLDPTGHGEGPGQTVTTFVETGTTGPLSCADDPEACSVELSLRRAVDILFVVDNSGSMGGEQGTLARSFRSFVDVLEAQEVGANYRIGVTTSAGDGALQSVGCRSRLPDFVFEWQFGVIDERQRGCLDNCGIDGLVLAEPWVEKSSGTTNLPPGVDLADALQCVGPPGINGPGFEAPLEAMRAALLDTGSGFLRDDALLAVIFVTDEADCSMPLETQSWIQTSGQVFWEHPDRASSAACWNAGVDCIGGPGVYDDCVAVDKAMSGQPTDNEDEAVLYPISRYVDVLTELAAQKQMMGGQGEVLVAALSGVPLDYPKTGEITYQDSDLNDFNLEFGIGPSCGRGTETIDDPPGIPPVRLKEFAELFASEQRNLFSICSDDYGVALTDIASALGEINERACVGGCVTDTDLQTAGLQPDCSLVETFADGQPNQVVGSCLIGPTEWVFPSDAVDVCYRALTDPDNESVTIFDDMTAQCVTVGSNLEFVIERREGVPVAAGTSVEVRCDLDAPLGVTCDEI